MVESLMRKFQPWFLSADMVGRLLQAQRSALVSSGVKVIRNSIQVTEPLYAQLQDVKASYFSAPKISLFLLGPKSKPLSSVSIVHHHSQRDLR